jgi:hypothetical protein
VRLEEENSRYGGAEGERSVIKTCSTALLGARVGRNLGLYYAHKKHQPVSNEIIQFSKRKKKKYFRLIYKICFVQNALSPSPTSG